MLTLARIYFGLVGVIMRVESKSYLYISTFPPESFICLLGSRFKSVYIFVDPVEGRLELTLIVTLCVQSVQTYHHHYHYTQYESKTLNTVLVTSRVYSIQIYYIISFIIFALFILFISHHLNMQEENSENPLNCLDLEIQDFFMPPW